MRASVAWSPLSQEIYYIWLTLTVFAKHITENLLFSKGVKSVLHGMKYKNKVFIPGRGRKGGPCQKSLTIKKEQQLTTHIDCMVHFCITVENFHTNFKL